MATALAHLVTGGALGLAAAPRGMRVAACLAMGLCSMLPDLDVLAFRLGIPYGHPLGHRGFMHSIIFAILFSVAVATLVCLIACRLSPGRPGSARRFALIMAAMIIALLLHDILDAMTTGGLGVGFFIPFSMERYFLPWRPIPVAPISLRHFFENGPGIAVLAAEARLLMAPAAAAALAITLLRAGGRFMVRRITGRAEGNTMSNGGTNHDH